METRDAPETRRVRPEDDAVRASTEGEGGLDAPDVVVLIDQDPDVSSRGVSRSQQSACSPPSSTTSAPPGRRTPAAPATTRRKTAAPSSPPS